MGIFVPAGPLTPAFPEGVARAGVRAAAASFEYRPLSLGLLISSGFQAPGGSPGRPFQGAVARAPGRGLQEIACGAGQAEVLLGSGLELEGPGGAEGKRQGYRPPRPRQPERFSCGWKARPRAGGPEGARPAGIGRPLPSQDQPFSCGQSRGQVGRRRWLVPRVETLQGS